MNKKEKELSSIKNDNLKLPSIKGLLIILFSVIISLIIFQILWIHSASEELYIKSIRIKDFILLISVSTLFVIVLMILKVIRKEISKYNDNVIMIYKEKELQKINMRRKKHEYEYKSKHDKEILENSTANNKNDEEYIINLINKINPTKIKIEISDEKKEILIEK